MKFTDAHIHILPGMDDGSDSTDTSIAMLKMLMQQGVEEIIATPHYYHHREKSPAHFLERRTKALEKLQAAMASLGVSVPIRLGAEIAVERGISEVEGIGQLAFTDSDLILLEYPYDRYQRWMSDEIHNIAVEYQFKPVVAHIHRYLDFFTKADMEYVLGMDVLFQINNEAFGSMRERHFVKKLLKEEYPVIFGSDSHNISDRKPNWDLLSKKCGEKHIITAAQRLRSHLQ